MDNRPLSKVARYQRGNQTNSVVADKDNAGQTMEAQVHMHEQISVAQATQQFCGQWLRLNDRSEKTIRGYSTDLRQLVETTSEGLLLTDLSRKHVEHWILGLRDAGYAAASIRRKLASLRALIRYCVDRALLTTSPLNGLTLRLSYTQRLVRTLSDDDLFALVDYPQRDVEHASSTRERAVALRNGAIVRLLCATGIRVGELVALNSDDVLDHGATLRVLGKGRRERLAFLGLPADVSCLDHYLVTRPELSPASDALFLNNRGHRLTTEGVRRVIHTLAQRAGATSQITPHMLRHTAATRLLQQGVDLRIVQSFLGHMSIRSTERYTHVSPQHLRLVVSQCHPLNRAA